MARSYIGISGYDYSGWRGTFYPADVARKSWLAFASRIYDSVELNGTFYSLKSPATFERWASEVPDDGFVFAIKGGRFITHNLKLRNCRAALGNFFASGVLALGKKTGPFLWQLPASYRFDAERMNAFMAMLPRDSREGEGVARGHDHRLRRGSLTVSSEAVEYRHAFEVRHPSYFCEEFYDILRAHGHAFVIADTAGKFGYAEEVTADFVYVRLHGSSALYASDYTDEELTDWAEKIDAWTRDSRDVYVYFDNDAKVHAPYNAMQLEDLVEARLSLGARRDKSGTGDPGGRSRHGRPDTRKRAGASTPTRSRTPIRPVNRSTSSPDLPSIPSRAPGRAPPAGRR